MRILTLILVISAVAYETQSEAKGSEPPGQSDVAAETLRKHRSFFHSKDYDAALRVLDQVPSKFGPSIRVHLLRGVTLYHLGRFEKAYHELTRSAERREDVAKPVFYNLRSKCALGAGYEQEAYRDLAAYCSVAPDDQDHASWIASRLSKHWKGERVAINSLEQARSANNVSPVYLMWQGVLAFRQKQYKDAELYFTRYLDQNPSNQRGLYWRCRTRLDLDKESEAVNDYRGLLLRHPVFSGGFDHESARRTIENPPQLTHGKRQIERVRKDRPALAAAFHLNSPLSAWAAVGFNQRYGGKAVKWDPSFPAHIEYPAFFRYADKTWHIHVSSSQGIDMNRKERPTDSQCSALIYELENLKNRTEFKKLDRKAAFGKISRDDFVNETLQLEYKAELRARAFLVHIYYPWCAEAGQSVTVRDWGLARFLTLSDYLSSEKEDSQRRTVYRGQYRALRKVFGRFDQDRP